MWTGYPARSGTGTFRGSSCPAQGLTGRPAPRCLSRVPAYTWGAVLTVPTVVIVPQNTTVEDYLGAVFVVILAIILGLICIFMAIFFVVYRRSRVTKVTNLWYILSVLLGTLLVVVSLILWSVYQTKTICTFKSVLGMIGFGLIIGYRPLTAHATFLGVSWQSRSATFPSGQTTGDRPRG